MIQSIEGVIPVIPSDAYVHPTAVVIGDVALGARASVWPGAVLRGDLKRIIVGETSNIQDGAVVHTSDFKVEIGSYVSIGHRSVLHSCEIGSGTLIGSGAIILDAVKIGEDCVIGAGTVIPRGKVIPPRSVVVGNPYQIIRKVTQEDLDGTRAACERYAAFGVKYKRTGNIL
jgi:carbonic anhydrase/acetyltransferase-like protein (isoleucine patch superfamily)